MQESKIQKVILTVIFILIYTTTSLIRINAQSEDIIMEFEQVAQVSTGGDTFQTEVVDDVAYVIDMQAGLKAYDVSRPKRPRLLDSFDDGGVPHNFMIDAGADLLYLADHADGLEIYDISDPSNLDKIGEISSNPDLYEGEGVKVKGSVVNIFKLPLVSGGAYELSDGTGTIWVTTISGVPPKGEELLVKGTVHTTLKFDGKTFGVVINETTRKYA